MPQSILHISDLHRSPIDPISNDELISALVGDRERYVAENPKISPPSLIVVSGDIVQGVRLGEPDFSVRLEEQYQAAAAFLGELADRFVQGDRSKVIIVPGNHDVDWNTAFSAMKLVKEEPKNLAVALSTEGSKFRWDWNSKHLYEIVDENLYDRRLDAFWEFFEAFYRNAPLLRVHPKSMANLYSVFGGRAAVAAFNSCEGNDCFSFPGSIRRDAIARTHLDLSGPGQNYELKIAVWHHSIDGTPYRPDYMDADIVRGMVGRGFRLGLYGHQHRAQAVAQEVHLPGRERMAVVSAGSLCAGRYELPVGVHRQYNIIEIADNFQSARVHVRAMAVANLFAPDCLWDFGGRSYADIEWEPPTNTMGLIADISAQNMQKTIHDAELAFKSGDSNAAVRSLLRIPRPPTTYQRQLIVEIAFREENWPVLLQETDPPSTIDELAKRIEALCRGKEFDRAKLEIEKNSTLLNVPLSTVTELHKRILAMEAMKK